jgi:hypothetical protein
MRKSQAPLLAALACILAIGAGCSAPAEPPSGTDTRTKQERDRGNEPSGGMRNGGGGY